MKNTRLLFKLFLVVNIAVSFVVLATTVQYVSATSSGQYIVPISVALNANVSTGLIYLVPIPSLPPGYISQNYYVINEQGYYVYSYLFSNNPGYLLFYEPAPQTETYSLVYGVDVQSAYTTTQVFSFYYQFYSYNTSIWSLSGTAVSGGLAIMNGQDSVITFNTSAVRFTSPVFLYQVLSSQSVVTPSILYTGYIAPGSVIIPNIFDYNGTYSFSNEYLVEQPLFDMATSYLSTSGLQITPTSFYYDYEGTNIYSFTYPYTSPVLVAVTTNGTTLVNVGKHIPQGILVPQGSFQTNGVVIAQQITEVNNVFVVNGTLFAFIPTWLNGTDFVLANGTQIPVSGTLTLAKTYTTYVLNHLYANSNYIYFDDVPKGSVITVTYTNGTTDVITASGNTVNSVGSVSLVDVAVPAGSGITGFSIKLAIGGVIPSISLLVGFQDYVHKFGVLVENGTAYLDVAGNIVDEIGKVSFPAVFAVGNIQIGSTYYVLAQVESADGVYDAITPTSIQINPSVPYVNYNGTVPLAIPVVAETISTGLYYELSGLIVVTAGSPAPVQSQVVSLVTTPGLVVQNTNNGVNTAVSPQYKSSSLTLVGFQGYSVSLTYGNVQENLVVTNNTYSLNLPSNLQVVLAVSPTSRSIAITTSPVQVKPVVSASLNLTTLNSTAPLVQTYTNVFSTYTNLPFSPGVVAIIQYYAIGSIALISLTLSDRLWISLTLFAVSLLIVVAMLQMYSLLIFFVLALALALMLKRSGF